MNRRPAEHTASRPSLAYFAPLFPQTIDHPCPRAESSRMDRDLRKVDHMKAVAGAPGGAQGDGDDGVREP